jgi:hypothetical protein
MPSPITVTGLIVDEANNPATSGYVEFELSPLNQGLAYAIQGVCTIAKTVRGLIDATGHLKGVDGVSALVIWPNDLITPSNTLYTVTIAPNNKVTRVYNNVLLKSSTDPQDLSQLIFILPQPVVGTVIEGSPLVTESVIPAVDLAFSLGDPTHRFTHVYADVLDNNVTDLTVDHLHVKVSADNPALGSPFEIDDDLLVTGAAKANGNLETGGNLIFDTDAGAHTDVLSPAVGANFAHQLPATNGVLAPLDSPALFGNPTAPTPAPASNDGSVATTAFVKTFIAPASPVSSVFGRIGAVVAVGGDYDVSKITGAAPLNNPVFTGDPKAPTPAPGDNDTSIATSAFVTAAIAAAVASGATSNIVASTNGSYSWWKGPANLMIQWGRTIAGGSPVAFPQAFALLPIVLVVGENGSVNIATGSITVNGFGFNTSGVPALWIAIGKHA